MHTSTYIYLLFAEKAASVESGVGIFGQVLGPLLLLVEHRDKVGRLRLAQLDPAVVQRFLLQYNKSFIPVTMLLKTLVQNSLSGQSR